MLPNFDMISLTYWQALLYSFISFDDGKTVDEFIIAM